MHEDEAERLRADLEENRRQEEKLTKQLRAQVRVMQLRGALRSSQARHFALCGCESACPPSHGACARPFLTCVHSH